MLPAKFVARLKEVFEGPEGIRRFRRIWNSTPGRATRLVRNLLESFAASDGCRQVRELWRIDSLWFRSRESHRYASGALYRRYPIGVPDCAIEYENWGGANPGAALIRLLGVRARWHVLIGWTYASKKNDAVEPLEGLLNGLQKQRLMHAPVLVILLNGDDGGRMFKYTMFQRRGLPRWRTSKSAFGRTA